MRDSIELEIRGKKLPVQIRQRGVNLTFQAQWGDEWVDAPSLEALHKKLIGLSKQKLGKISVPFVKVGGRYDEDDALEVLEGALTGRHASNRNILVRWAGGKTEQANSWAFAEVMKPLSAEELREIKELVKQRNEIDTKIRAFVAAREFDAKAELDRALGAEGED